MSCRHLPPRALALARPLPLVPRALPRAVPPLVLALFPIAPRLFMTELDLDVDAGAPNLDDVREEVGKLEINEASPVLIAMSLDLSQISH